MNGYDLVTPDSTSRFISILFQRPDGSYEAAVSRPAGDLPGAVIADDLDGDGDIDLAVGSQGGVLVLTNLGQGAFSEPVPNKGSGLSATLLALDMDGDHAVDLVRPELSGNLLVLFNRGDAVFEDVATIQGPNARGFDNVVAADLDGDDRLDLALSANFQGISIAHNAGRRQFQPAVGIPSGKRVQGLAAADMDGDESPDLLALEYDPDQVSVAWNDGAGRFPTRTESSVPTQFEPHGDSLVLGDVNGDEMPDLAAFSNMSDSVSLLVNRGGRELEFRGPYAVGDRPWSLTAADLNLDGKSDFVTANLYFPDAVSVLLSQGDTLQPAIHFAARRGENPGHRFSVASVLSADVDRDGVPELITAGNDTPAVTVIRPGLTGTLDRSDLAFSLDLNANDVPDECETGSFVRGDSNGDGLINISDSIYTLSYLFLGGAAPPCLDAADIDDSGDLDLSDGHGINVFLFLGGSFPSLPGPFHCGTDPTEDALDCNSPAGCQ